MVSSFSSWLIYPVNWRWRIRLISIEKQNNIINKSTTALVSTETWKSASHTAHASELSFMKTCISFGTIYDHTYAIFMTTTTNVQNRSIEMFGRNKKGFECDKNVEWNGLKTNHIRCQNEISDYIYFDQWRRYMPFFDDIPFNVNKYLGRLDFSVTFTCVKCGDDPRNEKCDMILSPAKRDRRSRFNVSIINFCLACVLVMSSLNFVSVCVWVHSIYNSLCFQTRFTIHYYFIQQVL